MAQNLSKYMSQTSLVVKIIMYSILLLASLLSILPLLRIIVVSFTPGDKIFSTDSTFLPESLTLEHYFGVFDQTEFVWWVLNSVGITITTAFISVSLSATAAYALSRYRFPMRQGVFVFLMATQMVPAVMLLLPLYFMLKKFGLVDSYAGVIFIYLMSTLPFCIWLLKGYFDTIPKSLEQAAQVDGLSEVGAFWRIVLPLSTPSLAIAMLFCIVQIWNEYIVARVVLQSSELYTWPLGLFELQGDFDTSWGMFAAASVMVTLPVTAVFLASSRWLLSGLTVGGVKG